MPADTVEVVQKCSVCGAEISRFSAKKDNLFLSSYQMVSCPRCGKETQELREVALRAEAQEKEIASLPKSNR
jgi:DNA-directed RNA polymerase subunit RPC12/RpoP